MPRIAIVLLLLGLFGFGGVAHAHGQDARLAGLECSLCASGGHAAAVAPPLPAMAPPPCAAALPAPAPRAARAATRLLPSIRGPPLPLAA